MYMIIIPENIDKSKWFANGGKFILKTLMEGELVDQNLDEYVAPILPNIIKEGLRLNLNKSYKFYKGTRYNGSEIEEDLGAYDHCQIKKKYDIQPNDQWTFLEDYTALEIRRLCMRIKSWNTCSIRFVSTNNRNNGNGLAFILLFNDYESLSYKERSLLHENSIMTNNQGAFVILKTIFDNLTIYNRPFYEIVRQANILSFNDFEWKRYKYSQETD